MADKGKKGKATAKEKQFDAGKKLRPIYDAIDNGNTKGALKLLNADLQKYGDKPILLVRDNCWLAA